MRNRAIANGYNVGDVYESVDGQFGFRSNDQFGRQYFNKTDFGPQGGGFWNWTQTVIEGVGLIPALGEPADLINGVISGTRGLISGENSHYLEGSLHAASAIPVGGYFATAGKVALAASPLVVKPLKNVSGSLDEMAFLAKHQRYGAFEKTVVLRPEKLYTGSGKHGIKWTEGRALAMGSSPRRPQGQWGSLADLSYAGRMAGTLKPKGFGVFQLPPKHSSIVHPIDGTDAIKANSMWLKNKGNIQGTFHGYPMYIKREKRPIKD